MTMLFVHEANDLSGPSIVFLHGGGLSGRMWQPQMDALTDSHCLAPDLPEQGRSTAVAPFTLRSAADYVDRGGRARAKDLAATAARRTSCQVE